ncbi:MAG: type I restriction-modification system subunit M [Candidatus Sumerlaeia bacterium]|nr:type I restriction-modification system subunit M [Candidatus Sumerlaeia bacterium]
MTPPTKEEIFAIVWRACDTFRGAVDPSEYKNYILVTLFIKYLSDLARDRRAEYMKKYKGDETRVERAMAKERFVLPKESSFENLHQQRSEPNIGELMNIALEKLEDENKGKLDKVFRMIDFNSEANLGETKERNRRLKNLLEDFANPKLDLRPSVLGGDRRDIIGDVYEYLIGQFAANAGKKGGEFYTPPEVSTLLARLLDPQPGMLICDPACGSGSLLIRVATEIGRTHPDRLNDYSLFGQESNGSTWALCRMNMFLHGMDSARIEWCDTLNSPKLIENDTLKKFHIVVANPPFSLDKWGQEVWSSESGDLFKRHLRGIPPKSKADYAFILHMIDTALEGEGRIGVIVPHGVLFRGGSEGKIRRRLIEENLLEAVIGLPANLFFGTGIPAAIVLFNKAKSTEDVLFIDASREYDDGKNQNRLRPEDIEKITATYRTFETIEKYSYRATRSEIEEENDFNLNIPRYVDTFEEEEEINIAAVQQEIDTIESQLAETRAKMAGYLKELNLLPKGKKK